MASIYQQLVSGEVDVHHNGETLQHIEMPVWLFRIGETLKKALPKEEEEAEIMDTLVEHEVFSGFLSLGLQQAIVGLRAVCRPADLPGELKGELIKVSILADKVAVQERANDYKPKDLQRPKKEKTPEQTIDDAIATLEAAGMSKEQIRAKFGL